MERIGSMFAFILIIAALMPNAFSAQPWDNSTFSGRAQVNVTNAGGAVSNYAVQGTVTYGGDGSDIRVYCNGTELAQYAVEKMYRYGSPIEYYNVFFEVSVGAASFNDSCFIYYNASLPLSDASTPKEDFYWDYSFVSADHASDWQELLWFNASNHSVKEQTFYSGDTQTSSVKYASDVLLSGTNVGSYPDWSKQFFAVFKDLNVSAGTEFEIAMYTTGQDGKSAYLIFGKQNNETSNDRAVSEPFYALQNGGGCGFTIGRQNATDFLYDGASNYNCSGMHLSYKIFWGDDSISVTMYEAENNTLLSYGSFIVEEWVHIGGGEFAWQNVTYYNENNVTIDSSDADMDLDYGYVGFGGEIFSEYPVFRYRAWNEDVESEMVQIAEEEEPEPEPESTARVRIGVPNNGGIVRHTPYNFTYKPSSDEGQNATLCTFKFNSSPTYFTNSTPITMGEYNKREFSFPDNSSLEYSYVVTCVIGDENVTDSASFRLRTDGSADTKLEGVANTFATAIFVLMCLAILVGLATLATMGISGEMFEALVKICIAVIVLIVVVGSLLG